MPIQQGMNQHTAAVINTIVRGGRKLRSAGKRRRKSTKKSAGGSVSRKSSGRKIKFGSPAWRKKYKLGRKKK
jgi:hypothetical protein